MKLKFNIKKQDNSISHSAVFNSQAEGDAWVLQNVTAFGGPDLLVTAAEATEKNIDIQNLPVSHLDPVTNEPIYLIAKPWSVEVIDVTLEESKKTKVHNRTYARLVCLTIIDEIAAYNEDNASPAQMTQIFTNSNYMAITLALLTGAVDTAKSLIVTHGPSLYPQAMVDEFVAKLEAIP